MKRTYRKEKTVGFGYWGRVIALLLLPLLLSIYTFTGAAAQEVITGSGARLKAQEAYGKGQMDSSFRHFEKGRRNTAYSANGYAPQSPPLSSRLNASATSISGPFRDVITGPGYPGKTRGVRSGYEQRELADFKLHSGQRLDLFPLLMGVVTPENKVLSAVSDTGSISGKVTNSSGAGIENVQVQIFDMNGWLISSVSTVADGNYTVTGVPAGKHKVRFYGSHLGYVNELYNNKFNFGNADTVTVTALYTTSGIDAVLEPGGSVSGRVTNSNGAGIQNVWVDIYDTNWNWLSGTPTDADGNYIAAGVPTGQHKVRFYSSPLGYVNEWYNNKLNFGNADTVSVTALYTTSGIDAVLEPGGSISGRVTDSNGAGIQDVWVYIYDTNWNWFSGTPTDVNGNYTATGIPAGQYKVEFNSSHLGYIYEWYNNKADFGSADLVAVTVPNITSGIDAVLEVGGSVSGRVTDSAGAGIQNVEVVLSKTTGEWSSNTSTDVNGFYTLTGIRTGVYNVYFWGSQLGYGYMDEWYDNKPVCGNADPVFVTAPLTTSGIDAVLEVGGSISGRVTDSNGTGIQSAGVDIYDTNECKISWALTDANGNYTIINIPTGQYKVQFSGRDLGFVNEWYDNKSNLGDAITVPVTASLTTTGIDAVLEPGGSISGRVTDSAGAGIPGIVVTIYNLNYDSVSGGYTDANGNYTVNGIPAGQHKVRFFDGSNMGYLTEWYNGKSDFGNADAVPVTASLTTSGIDAVLDLGGSVSGRVTDFAGVGIQNVQITIYKYTTNYEWISSTLTDANGNYTVIGIPTGVYKLEFYGTNVGYLNEWYNNKADIGNGDTVAVIAPNATAGIDAVLELGGTISGRVTDSTGSGIQNVAVGIPDTNRNWISSASTDADGNYTVIGIPTGAYKVDFWGSDLGYLNEWYNNKYNICNADPVAVTAPNTTAGIDAVLALGGSISGRVTNSAGTGIQHIGVNIINTNGERISEQYSEILTDANGNYTVIGIPTGSYKVEFYGSDLGYIHEWYNNKTDFGNADLVAVTAPNATVGIDAVLEVGGSISGRVTDFAGTGIQNLSVGVFNTNGDGISWAITDANGNYTAGGVPMGIHKVRFFHSYLGYPSEWYNNKPDFGSADTVSVTAPNTTTGVDAVLESGNGGSISGRVTDSTGAGIWNVWVKVFDPNWAQVAFGARSDADGNYIADGLSTGQYKVQFAYDGCSGYLSEWYNNKPDSVSADTVAVTAPDTTAGIDAVLSVQTWFEENDPAITYTGLWSNYTCALCSGGAIKISNKTGAKATFTFNGTGVKWIAAKAKNLGKAKVYVDGVYKTTIDLYSDASTVKQPASQVTGLTSGSHTITIVVTGQKNPNSTGYYIDIDAFEVVP